MSEKKTSLLSNGLLWFGAAISIAEILTGTYYAPLGFKNGVLAILLGHVIGCTLLYLAGLIGAKSGLSSMASVRISFGKKGSYIFSIFNILQLIGWTAVMIIGAAKALRVVSHSVHGFDNQWIWCLVIGALVIVWILIGLKNLDKLNIFAVGGLLILSIVLSRVIFKSSIVSSGSELSSFGMLVELSVAMSLSWLPLISDYTRHAGTPKTATLISVLAYFFGSSWMFIMGLGATLYLGTSDIAQILLSAGPGIVAMLILLFSTVTTTFLDVYSAGVSFFNMSEKISEKWVAIIVCIIGTLIAMFTPIEQYQNFLYLIGSVFAPMVAILFTDYYILKKKEMNESINIINIAIWIVGFILYRMLMNLNTVMGSTLPVMIMIVLLCIIINGGKKYVRKYLK